MKFDKLICAFALGILSLSYGSRSATADQVESQSHTTISKGSIDSVVTEGFNLSLKTDKSEYAVGARIDIEMLLKDVSHPRWTTEEADRHTYSLDIVGSDGESVDLTAAGEQYAISKSRMYADKGLMDFFPGDKETVPLYNAQGFFNMSKPDVYTMQATRQVPSLEDPEKMVTIYSNVVKIRIAAPQEDE
ncbi:MAG TPA: hypothetical protein VF600_03435 [Abditibacteriaceae bacterium]|jgi:hypothetical protein